ncbi:MAG: radical SAM/SPASM domain-containing protein [Chloroflexota bacterium]
MGAKYSKLKIFHYQDKLDSLPPDSGRTLPPIHIRMKPTNVCNHNCSYCAYRAEGLQLGQDMNVRDSIPREKALEIIDDFIDMGVRAISFSGGGEPLCYPYILEISEKLAASPIKFAALTNGSRLDGEIAELFAKSASWIRISIDGWDDESYAKYRSVRVGEFSKVMRNIENFKKLGGDCYLGVSLIVDEQNKAHVYEFSKRLKDMGVNNIKISPCIISNDAHENNEYHKPFFNLVKSQAERVKTELGSDDYEVFDAYHELDGKFEKDYDWCPYLQIVPVIGADLNVYSCRDKAYNLEEGLIGSIKDVSFKDFWMNDKEKFYKLNPKEVCKHHCCVNSHNQLIMDYLGVDTQHLDFA